MKFSLNDLYPNSGLTNTVSTSGETIPESEERASYIDTTNTSGDNTSIVDMKSTVFAILGFVVVLYLINKA